MANSPVVSYVPYFSSDGVSPATGYWIKGYQPGTTTALTMYTDSTTTTPLTKAQINSAGLPATAGGTIFAPHFAAKHDLWLFTTEAAADANDTSGARKVVDNGILIPSLNQTTKIFTTVSAMKADASVIAGDTVRTTEHTSGYGYEGGNVYLARAVTGGTDDNGSLIKSTGNTAIEFVALFPHGPHVKHWGAKLDGTVDDLTALQAASDWAPAGTELKATGNTAAISGQWTINNDNIVIKGNLTVKAQNNSVFEYLLLGTSRTNVVVDGLTFDANRANRTSGQNVRYMGAAFLTSTDCKFLNCTGTNAVGYNNIPGVALAIAGNSIRGKLISCTLYNNGGTSGTDAADGIFTSGEQNLIANCVARNCTDTGFVIESSNLSGIIGCTADLCAAGAAITNATADDKIGNYINGITISNWNASNTGGIQIGCPVATTGNLYYTRLDGVVMYASTGSHGAGAAINIRNAGSGKAINVTINAPQITGSQNQGILIDGDQVRIIAPQISGTTDACVQFQSGSKHLVLGGYLDGGSFGVVTTNSAVATVKTVVCDTNSTGIYADDTSTINSVYNTILTPLVGYEGAAVGATLNFIGHRDFYPAFDPNLLGGSAPSGSLNNEITYYGLTGTPGGVIPFYNS